MNNDRLQLTTYFQDSGLTYYYRYKTIPVERLTEIRAEMENLAKTNRLCPNKTFRRYLSRLTNTPPADFPSARSVIILALFKPMLEISVRNNRQTTSICIPPNYLSPPDYALDDATYHPLVKIIEAKIIGQKGHTIRQSFNINLKRLAVCSGLGKYGRNNLCYVEEMGSFHTLMAFFTDYAFAEDEWHDPQWMESCGSCKACVKSCPNNAIPESPDDIILDVEKCLSLYNEVPGEIPAWIPGDAHKALIGCLACQKACPANRKAWKAGNRKTDLTEEETGMLLGGRFRKNACRKCERSCRFIPMSTICCRS